MERNEFVLLDDYSYVYVEMIKSGFKINEFVKSDNGSIKFCLNFYKIFIEVWFELELDDILVEIVLMWVIYLSIILFMFVLFVIFVIYCILLVLRIILGKNLMCFVFFFFFV